MALDIALNTNKFSQKYTKWWTMVLVFIKYLNKIILSYFIDHIETHIWIFP